MSVTPLEGFHHVALPVTDLARAEAFYGGVLGLRVIARHDDAAGRPRSLWLDVGRGAILMLERAPPVVPHDGPPVVALAIRRGDREAWERRLADPGVPIEKRSSYSLYLRDPDGNRIAVSHYPEPAE